MSWWTDIKEGVSDAYHGAKDWVDRNLDKADNWLRKNVGGDIYVGGSAPVDGERIDQYENTMNPNTATAGGEPSGTDWGAVAATTAANIGYQEYTRRQQNKFNAQQAQQQRDYEERLSNTAYQRSIADMKAAGINPAVAFGGGASGASTPAGSTATASTGQSLDLAGIISSNTQAALTGAQIDNMKADTNLKEKQSGKTKAETNLIQTQDEIQNIVGRAQEKLLRTQNKKEQIETMKAAEQTIRAAIENYYYMTYGHEPGASAMSEIMSMVRTSLGKATGAEDVALETINAIRKYARQ